MWKYIRKLLIPAAIIILLGASVLIYILYTEYARAPGLY